jgi:hypothetical protein
MSTEYTMAADENIAPGIIEATQPVRRTAKIRVGMAVAVPVISLPVELGKATLGGIVAGLGTFVGALTATNANDLGALKSAGIAAGFVAVTFFSNSLNNWYQQRYSTTV